MKIRRYIAKDMRHALAQVRDAQGPDAVILSSRRNADGVEVVAAVDFDAETFIDPAMQGSVAARNAQRSAAQAHERYDRYAGEVPGHHTAADEDEYQRPLATAKATAQATAHANTLSSNRETTRDVSPKRRPTARDEDGFSNIMASIAQAPLNTGYLDNSNQELNAELRTLRRMLETQIATLAWNDLNRRAPLQTALLKDLTQLGFCHSLAIDVVTQIPARMEWQEAQRTALAMIAKRIPVASERWVERGGMVAMVGPTGVGKTTLIAKLAARWVLRHGPREMVLISADSVRMGAQDQIQNLGRLLAVPTYSVDQLSELNPLLNSLGKYRLVLIDTAGFSQRDQRLAAELALLATSHAQLETALVISASAQAGALEESFLRFTAAAPRSCVITKVDEATSLGGVISTLSRHELPLMYVSEGQRIPEDLQPARAHQLVARAVELARRTGAQAEEEVLSLKFGGVAHALA